ncbi:MAG: 3-deoxy-manno-octulosonate-8-phosphatase KdsC [Xanthomonadales bacterium]|nr:3-deoxy-manno-octulosonate-8-phosphatase KdsC [Gammaproteobacteria bacterium]MBT8053056.1 3-deoxy-manno-octulosonate-8-phosphatase KdsC [Gammaproteobacteria bacterium]NND56700.1 3-deoxy-manno-octulosonate-8-phosphatase KdsC [Xanthomonadales bacterium]NNK52685.1 3-deoxy-manno-octulosonate-8-phosphatase KdsC [Xanthomonadales bacterium]
MLVLDVDGVLTDGRLYFDNQGNEMKAFCTRDGLGIKALQSQRIELAFITGRQSEIVAQRSAQLGVEHVYQGRNDKLNAFNELLSDTGMSEQNICYAGDDWIDIPVLDRVGLSVTVADADPVVKNRVHWVTSRAGGKGAVREICDLILAARGLDQQVLDGILKL